MCIMKNKNISRRYFTKSALIKSSVIASMVTAPAPPSVLGANEKVIVGTIGARGQGTSVSSNLVQNGNVEIAAICDVDQTVLDQFSKPFKRRHQQEPKHYNDFRDLLEMNEIDAVVIASPDHWHALHFCYACEAGKDIYLETPISHSISEGQVMVKTAKKHNRVVQVGTWYRSIQHVQDSIDYIKAGKLGDVSVCRAWFVENDGSIGNREPETPPSSLDWNSWLGPAPKNPFQKNKYHWNWRMFYDYGGGMTTFWGTQMLDIICLGMNSFTPKRVSSFGGKYLFEDDRETPDTQIAVIEFENFVIHLEARHGNKRGIDAIRSNSAAEWIGTTGTLGVHKDAWEYFYEKAPKKSSGETEIVPETVNELNTNHFQNFIDCIKTRKTPRSDIDTSHQASTLCHLANISYQTGKVIEWDAEKEVITNEPDAMNCRQYKREYRSPWLLPNI